MKCSLHALHDAGIGWIRMIGVDFVQALDYSLLSPMTKVILKRKQERAAVQSHGVVYRSASAVGVD
jgi:hypothetical protein